LTSGRVKCTKFDFCWGFAPEPAAGAYNALPDSLVGFKRAGRGMKGEGKGWERRGRKGMRGEKGGKFPHQFYFDQ